MKKSEIKQLIIGVFTFILICIGTSCAHAQTTAEESDIKLNSDIISGIKFHLLLDNGNIANYKYELKCKIIPSNFESVFYISSEEEFVLHKDYHYIFDISYTGYNTVHLEVITDGMNSSRLIESTLTFHKNNNIINDGIIIFDVSQQKFIIHP